jgi:putative spermidine/putrescine transport system substrate-binding protein
MRLIHAALAVGTAMLPLLSGAAAAQDAPEAEARAVPQKDLTIVSWGGSYTRSQMLAYVKPYRAEIGEWVQMETYGGGLDEIREQVETANVTWDVVDFEQSDLLRACEEGLLEKADPSILSAGADGTPAAEDFIAGAMTECGYGQTIWATVVAYDTERVGDTPPSTLADFFDVGAYPGKRGIRRDPRVVMEWALIADGVAPADVYDVLATEDGQAQAFAMLDNIKTSIVWWDDGEEPIALLANDDVVMTSVWNGRTYRPIVEAEMPMAILWDGQVWDIDSWGIPAGSDNLEKAKDFIRFSTDTERLADQANYISYGPARRSSMALIPDDIKMHLPTLDEHLAHALQLDAEWWAANQEALTTAFEAWLISGGRGLAGSAR